MKRVLKFCATCILVAPSLWMTSFVLNHLRQLNSSEELYSFGLYLRYGGIVIYDRWSDVLVLFCCATAIVCAIGMAFAPKKTLLLFGIGLTALLFTAIGIVGALLE